MFRMTALTLAGLAAVLVVYGEPQSGAATAASTPAVVAAAPAAKAAPGIDADVSASLIEAAMAAPANPAPTFAGPPLKPAPDSAAAQAPAPAADGTLYVAAASVNLRAGPGTDTARVGSLPRGTAVVAEGPTSGAWVQIRDASGMTGYVSAKFLSANAPG